MSSKADMSTSVFTYNLTRPYPYRWYTPLIIVGFLLAAVLFSFLNYVSSGYTLQAKYLFDSNATTWSDSDLWLKYWPSAFVGSIKPTCQPSSLPVGTTLVTNNSALPWTITNVTLRSGDDDSPEPLSSLVYQSNFLEECQFRSITLYLDSYLGGRAAPQISWSQWGAEVEGRMYCQVQNDLGVNYVNLTASYNLLPRSAFENNNTFTFPGRNSSLYSLWWGESLLSASWWDFVNVMASNGSDYVAGVITLTPETTSGTSRLSLVPRGLFVETPRAGNDPVSIEKPITALPSPFAKNTLPGVPALTASTTFFNVESTSTMSINSATLRRRANDTPSSAESLAEPDVKNQADTLGLVFLSIMWTDLGQSEQDHNIFQDPELLRAYSDNLTEITLNLRDNQTIGPETAPYKPSPDGDARLVVNPSILVTDYLCQVPQRKPWGSLITSILVADIVFLRTLWAIVTFIASHFAKRQSPLANSCESCLPPFDDERIQGNEKVLPSRLSEAGSSVTVVNREESQRSTLLVQRASLDDEADLGHMAEQRP